MSLDALGILQEGSGGGSVRGAGECPSRGGGAFECLTMGGRLLLYAANLWRLFGLFRYCHRMWATLWHSPFAQLCATLLLTGCRGILAAMAYLADHMVLRLPVYPARWESCGALERHSQHVCRLFDRHGANWTFLAWGAFHATCFLPLLLRGKNRRYVSQSVAEGKYLPSLREAMQMGMTFLLAMVGWVFFRAPTVGMAGAWLRKMFLTFDGRVTQLGLGSVGPALTVAWSLLLLEWCNRGRESPRLPENRWLRWGVYYAALCAIVFLRPKPQGFVYFQF